MFTHWTRRNRHYYCFASAVRYEHHYYVQPRAHFSRAYFSFTTEPASILTPPGNT